MSEKTEKPSRKKLEDARKKGQLARSRVLSSAAVCFGGVCGLLLSVEGTAHRLLGWLTVLLNGQEHSVPHALEQALTVCARAVAPPLLGAVSGALAVGVLSAGLSFRPETVLPKFERIDPSQGFERLFRFRSVIDVLKSAAMVVLLAGLLTLLVRPHAATLLRGARQDGLGGWWMLLNLLQQVLLKSCLALGVFGAFDYGLMRWRHQKDLMMSRDELKREHKDAEGDPHHRKRRSAHRALAQGGPARGISKATAVVVNPTHIAVALRYADGECEAPYLVAKGRDEEAFDLRREARRLGIPVVKDIPLARSLIHYDVGEEIPEELYRAAAVVLKARRRSQRGYCWSKRVRTVISKVLPWPSAERSNRTSPPISRASPRANGSPNPAPPPLEDAAWTKGRKICSCAASAMPAPLSLTWKTRSAFAPCCSQFPERVTVPPRVNLSAFPTTLVRIWCRRTGSVSTRLGRWTGA